MSTAVQSHGRQYARQGVRTFTPWTIAPRTEAPSPDKRPGQIVRGDVRDSHVNLQVM